MESSSVVKECCCGRGVTAWRSRKATVGSYEGKVWIGLETPRLWRCQGVRGRTDMGYLLRKVVNTEWYQPRREKSELSTKLEG